MSFTPMDFSNYTVAELRGLVKEAPANLPAGGYSKMRKAELVDWLVQAHNTAADLATGVVTEEQLKDEQAQGEPQVYQGAMHEAGEDTIGALMRQANQERKDVEAVDELVKAEFGDLDQTLRELAGAARSIVEPTQAAAKALGRVAYGHLRATVRSMGHRVTGKVVDTVVRTPDASGEGRVLVVFEHPNGGPGRKATRTLHRITDVEFSPLAS